MMRRYGHRFGAPDPRDHHIAMLVGARRAAETRPASITFEQLCEVKDQGQTSSCEAHAWSQAMFVRAATAEAAIPFPSRAALIALAYEHDQGSSVKLLDQGTYARTVGYVLTTNGVCNEERWPFVEMLQADGSVQRPPWDVLQASGDARSTGYAAIASSGAELCEDIRDALAKGYPVTFGMEVDQAFEDGNFETYGGLSGPSLGGHALCIVGFEPGRFRVVNSWSTAWNDGGFFWISDGAIQAPACGDFYSLDVSPKGLE